MSTLWPVQVAIVAAIQANAVLMAMLDGDGIYDEVPEEEGIGQYISFGESTEQPARSYGKAGFNETETLHIWSEYRGAQECKKILTELNRTLDGVKLPLDGATMIRMAYEFSSLLVERNEQDQPIRHMPVRYRVRTTV